MRRSLLSFIAPLMMVACNDATAPGGASAQLSIHPSSSNANASLIAPAKPVDSAKPAPPPPTPDEVSAGSRYAKANNAFGFDIYKEVRKTPGNLAMSPTSLSIALAMTWAGAKGQTSVEMKKVLHFERSPADTMSDAGMLTKLLENPSRPLRLSIANRLFGQKTYTFEKPYLESTEKAFGASLEAVDFKTNAEAARATINGWVEQKTEKRVTDLVPARGVDETTRLVLVNAVYFMADWQRPFNKSATRPDQFFVTAEKKVEAPMMQQIDSFNYAEVSGTQLVELPYLGGQMSMLLAIPRETSGIEKLERSLSSETLAAWTKALKSERLHLSMPRFEVNPSASMSLKSSLQVLGLKAAFEPGEADFTAMANPSQSEDRLSISKVFHKAFVKVDEKGTEAAAASAVVMAVTPSAMAPPPPPKVVKVDRPFVYFIRDNGTGLVLFLGRVADPTVK